MLRTTSAKDLACEKIAGCVSPVLPAARGYSILTALQKTIGVMPVQDYRGARQEADLARERAEQVRVAYERHIRDHGCAEESDTE